MTCHCRRDHGNHILTGKFFKISISLIKKNNNKMFLAGIFKFLDHFMVFLFDLITFEPILDGCLRSWINLEIQDGGPRWPPFGNDYAIALFTDIFYICITMKLNTNARQFRAKMTK